MVGIQYTDYSIQYTVLMCVDTEVPSSGSLPKQRSQVQLASPGTDHPVIIIIRILKYLNTKILNFRIHKVDKHDEREDTSTEPSGTKQPLIFREGSFEVFTSSPKV